MAKGRKQKQNQTSDNSSSDNTSNSSDTNDKVLNNLINYRMQEVAKGVLPTKAKELLPTKAKEPLSVMLLEPSAVDLEREEKMKEACLHIEQARAQRKLCNKK